MALRDLFICSRISGICSLEFSPAATRFRSRTEMLLDSIRCSRPAMGIDHQLSQAPRVQWWCYAVGLAAYCCRRVQDLEQSLLAADKKLQLLQISLSGRAHHGSAEAQQRSNLGHTVLVSGEATCRSLSWRLAKKALERDQRHHGRGVDGHPFAPQTKGTARPSEIKVCPTSRPFTLSVPQLLP
ncbi:Hypothetical protein NGAL_HAMBI1146_31920 [Neorhizobium galegae bv. officinalis]|nr:Hypothetical protein NGAL_HAMBI1146_31920 [Neorhizobium galegae bv. officinalis]